jgi:ABC-type multidrug transport system fused ATPase/permease subunit
VKLFWVTGLQILLSLLDLAGVALIGVIGALSINGIQSKVPGDRVAAVLSKLHLSSFSFQTQVAILGLLAVVLLVGRSLFSVYFTRKILYFLSLRASRISSTLVSKLLALPILKLQLRSSQANLFAVTAGVDIIALRIIGATVSLIADTSLLILMTFGLFIVDPMIATGTFLFFLSIGLGLYKYMHIRAKELGAEQMDLTIKNNEAILNILGSYRENVVSNRREYFARVIGSQRLNLAKMTAELQFMPNLSKYVIETAVVLGALGISAVQFTVQDSTRAVGLLAVFLAAGTRIAPAVLRVQQGIIQISSSIAGSTLTLAIIDEFRSVAPLRETRDEIDLHHVGFLPSIKISHASFRYPESADYALKDVSLDIDPGRMVAIVGSSGAGKTTLVDALLGILETIEGKIEISGLHPLDAFNNWPGAVAYVPQDVVLINGSVRENLALGYEINSTPEEHFWHVLEKAQLSILVKELADGLDSIIGERGSRLSGGQRQRLGIARALFTNPGILVLDEATSALDGQTEADIGDAINSLKGKTTIIMIAHRLSTVRSADAVIYMENGKILATGTFDEVRKAVPDFDRQAQLMGL